MKNLNLYIKESLLDDEEELVNDKRADIQIWINKHKSLYNMVGPEINSDGTIDARKVEIRRFVDFEGFPDYIKFNNVEFFNIENCPIKNLQGFPKQSYRISIYNCRDLETIDGIDKDANIENFILYNDSAYTPKKLKSLKGAPDAKRFVLRNVNITDLSGIGKVKVLQIYKCDKLKTLNPMQGLKDLHIFDCHNLKDISKLSKSLIYIRAARCNLEKKQWEGCLKKNGDLDFE